MLLGYIETDATMPFEVAVGEISGVMRVAPTVVGTLASPSTIDEEAEGVDKACEGMERGLLVEVAEASQEEIQPS